MAKKATTTKQNNNNEPGKFAMMKMFFTNERTRFITGLVIAIITIYIGLALISFFFTGGADQSKIENVPLADLLTNRGSVENWTGVRGAVLADLLMNRWFGISSFMILFFLFLTVCVIEGISSLLSQIIREERSLSPLGKRLLTGTAVLLALVCTLSLQPPDFSHISPRAVQAMISGLFHPDWAFFFETDTSGLGYLLLETVCIALVGTCAGTVIAVPLSFLSTPCLMPQLPALLFRVVIMAIRSVPFLIYGLIFIRVAGPGPFTGVLTLGICSVGLLSKRFTEAIDSLDFRAYHALESMGVPLLLRIRYAVLPQLLPALASAVLYRFDVNIREASVLGLVGAGGIGAPLIFAMNHYKWSEAGAIALGLILLVWCIDRLSASLRR